MLILAPLLLTAAAAAGTGIDAAVHDAVRATIDPGCGPRPTGEIVVCRRNDAQRRFRLPEMPDQGFDPLGSVDSVSRSRHRLIDGDGESQDLTRGSCSATGASGWTGCQIKAWRERDQQKGQ